MFGRECCGEHGCGLQDRADARISMGVILRGLVNYEKKTVLRPVVQTALAPASLV